MWVFGEKTGGGGFVWKYGVWGGIGFALLLSFQALNGFVLRKKRGRKDCAGLCRYGKVWARGGAGVREGGSGLVMSRHSASY